MAQVWRNLFYKMITIILKSFGLLPWSDDGGENLYLSGRWYFFYQIFLFSGIVALEVNQFMYVNLGKNHLPGPAFVVLVATAMGARTILLTVYLTILIDRKRILILWKQAFFLSHNLPPSFWHRLTVINTIDTCMAYLICFGLIYTADYRDYHGHVSLQNIFVELSLPLLTTSGNCLNLLAGNLLRILTGNLESINIQLTTKVSKKQFKEMILNLELVRGFCDDWNSVFGLAYLHFFALISIGFLYSLFHVIVSPPRYYDAWWMCFYVWGPYCILNATSAATFEMQKTAAKLLVNFMDADSDTNNKVDLFSHQQLHDSPKFHACSFFNLDWGLATAIIGATSTYTIIFYQMQNPGSKT